jgi:PPP family 3-phenylpropionic acid transporter
VGLVFCAMFGATGVLLPFLPAWLQQERGLSGLQVGAIIAVAQLARIVVSPPLGAWADGFADRRTPILVFTSGALLAYAVYFNVLGFAPIFLAAFVAATLHNQITPLTEAMALRRAQEGPLSYGVLRGMGSGAFILANIVGGAALTAFGPSVLPIWALSTLALAVVAALFLAPDPGPPNAPVMTFGARMREGAALMRRPRFALVVVGAGLIQSSHAFYYVFSAPIWASQGLSATVIGMLWGFGVLVEVVLFLTLVRWERRFPPELFMALGAGAAVLRWSAMGFAPLGASVWLLQALHALTFAATHVGTMRLIQREAPEAMAGLAQTFYASLAGGLLLGLMTFASGALFDWVGPAGYWAMAASAALGAACVAQLARIGR